MLFKNCRNHLNKSFISFAKYTSYPFLLFSKVLSVSALETAISNGNPLSSTTLAKEIRMKSDTVSPKLANISPASFLMSYLCGLVQRLLSHPYYTPFF